jgi:glycerol-3-phosphate dehydrogenase (NAD(P)+)
VEGGFQVKVAVLGTGSWGLALTIHIANAGHTVVLWGWDPAETEALRATRTNPKFLPGIELPPGVIVVPQLPAALEDAEVTLFAVPSHGLRGVAAQVAATGARSLWVSGTKGLELGSLVRMSEVLKETLGDSAPVVLTGPSFASEVVAGIPTSVVAASADEGRARLVQVLCSTPLFRVYTNDDVAGCEYGAALKNVIAIAAGICDGVGFGDNTKGALLTRGLAEISRLGVAMGGRRETFFGLTGLGDLFTTATSRHSRNRSVGEEIGRGRALDAVLGGMVMVAEGVNTARVARELGRRHGVALPITEQVCSILFDGKSPLQSIRDLMTRDLKKEL